MTAVDRQSGGTSELIGTGRALAVDNEQASPVGTGGDAAWVPASRNEAQNRTIGAAAVDDCQCINAAERDEKPPVGEHGQAIGIEPLPQRLRTQRSRHPYSGFAGKLAAGKIQDGEAIVIILGRNQLPSAGIIEQCRGFADRRHSACYGNSVEGDGED